MMRRWMMLNGVLALIVVGLAVQIVRTWARALPVVEARTPGRVAEPAARTGEGGKRGKRGAQGDKAPQTPAALVTAIVNKDLFDPSRSRPSEESKAAVVAVEVTPPPGISLVGIRMLGKDREGFILDATQGNVQRRIRLGDTVANFTVKTIRSSSVVLAAGTGEYVTLTLEVDKSKAAGGAATPPARPGRGQAAAAAAAAAAGGAGSPAAGVAAGSSPAAGVGGGAVKPPVVAAGTAAAPPPATPQPPAPGTPPTPPAVQPKMPPISPNLPEGVRQKLEQMRQNRK